MEEFALQLGQLFLKSGFCGFVSVSFLLCEVIIVARGLYWEDLELGLDWSLLSLY